MTWRVVTTETFDVWWDQLEPDQQDALTARVLILRDQGPALGRPLVDTITSSRHANMKELRASKQGALRVLFAFDPLRQAVLLIGGDKTDRWQEWYREAIPLGDDLFAE